MRRTKSIARAHTDESLGEEIAHLSDLDLKGLRSRWQSVTGRQAAAHLPRHLLIAMIAYRIQADVMGDLDVETRGWHDVAGANSRELVAARGSVVAIDGGRAWLPVSATA